ncbi:hypothetical protein ACFQ1S_21290, partial [Kibdelosporangium lantanae]
PVQVLTARQVYARMIRDTRFLAYLTASASGMLVYASSVAVLPLNIVADGYPTGLYSAVLMISSIVVITCELKVTTYIIRIPKRFAGFSGNLVSGVGYVLYGLMAGGAAFVVIGALLVVAGTIVDLKERARTLGEIARTAEPLWARRAAAEILRIAHWSDALHLLDIRAVTAVADETALMDQLVRQ